MDLGLRGKVAIITGASNGIGRATAVALAREGCRLALGARSVGPLQEVQSEVRTIGGADSAIAVAGDLTSPAGVSALVEAAVSKFSTVDILVTCVGGTPIGSFDELADEVWQVAFDMKFLSTVRAARAVLPHMRKQRSGRIVFVAGNAAQGAPAFMATSGVMNAGLGSLARVMALRFAGEGISVNCVNPGPVRTARFEGLKGVVAKSEGITPEAAAGRIAAGIPDGRVAEAEEVAALIAYLASPLASHINGNPLVIDGAQTWAR